MGMTIAIDKSYMNRMPKSCKECPLTYLDTGDDAYFGANERRCVIDDSCIDGMVSERAYDCPLIEAIPKADYEARLKSDLKAILVELQLEIEEYKRDLSNKDITKDHEDFDHNNLIEVISGNIQQKINLLKENEDVK